MAHPMPFSFYFNEATATGNASFNKNYAALNGAATCKATSDVITDTGHGLSTYDFVHFTATGTLPAGLSSDTDYRVSKIDANTYKVATTAANIDAGVFVDLTSTGTGAWTAKYPFLLQLAPGAGQTWNVQRLIIHLEDTTSMQVQEFGNLGAALTEGIRFFVMRGNDVINDLTGGHANAVKTNGDLSHLCYDVDVKTWGSGNEVCVARWSFNRFSKGIELRGDNSEKLVCWVNESTTGLLDFRLIAQGYSVDINTDESLKGQGPGGY